MDIWKHGKYIDMWSTVHLLSGYSLFLIFNVLGYEYINSMVFSIALLILWEFFEWLVDIIEPTLNVMSDLFIGTLGFFIGVFLHHYLNIYFNNLHLGIIIGITLTLSLWGFYDYLKRGYR